jgi:hypothetical protein
MVPLLRAQRTKTTGLTLLRFAALLGAVLASGSVPNAAQEKWTVFRFKNRDYSYAVQYPAGWSRLPNGTSELDVVNYTPPKDDFGLLFHPAGHPNASPDEIAAEAELAVNAHPPEVQTVEEWMIQELRNEVIQKDERLMISKPVAANGCLRMRRVIAANDLNGQIFLDTYYYCTTRAGLFEIILTNRPDHPRQAELRALALKMALSLRVP